jgi:hypothetical protein
LHDRVPADLDAQLAGFVVELLLSYLADGKLERGAGHLSARELDLAARQQAGEPPAPRNARRQHDTGQGQENHRMLTQAGVTNALASGPSSA